MEYKITKSSGEASFEIKFSDQEWEAALEAAAKKDAGKYTLPGFRKGKVPRGVIEKNFGKDVFFDTAINALFPPAFGKILDENKNIVPVQYPEVSAVFKDAHVVIKGTVITRPEFELGKYKGLTIPRTKVVIEDKHIDEYLERMRSVRARVVDASKGHKLVLGDIAIINFVGSINGTPFPGGTAENYELELGSNSFIDTFETQLVGRVVGDTTDVKVSFPKNYHAIDLAGKSAVFNVTVNGIKVKELPIIDDTLASEISEFKTLKEWRDDIKSKMQQESDNHAKRQDEDQLITKVVEETKIDLPEKLVQAQIEHQIQEFEHRLSHQSATLDGYLEYAGMSHDEFQKTQRETAVHICKTRLVFEEIIKVEKLKTDTNPEIEFNKIIEFLKSVNSFT